MGIQASCFDSTRLATHQDSVIERTYTDGELTEFLASANHLFVEDVRFKRQNCKRVFATIEIPRKDPEESVHTPKFEINSAVFTSIDRTVERKHIKHSRIYSSNANINSVNLIEKINTCHSLCSTNVNSRTTSRCVSPLIRAKPTLME